ncbi:hypothetical protein K440DRAFT_613344 [Wilcoxina mikolae CBS 423.85]|nr:hypothetical protein K440DRAFT_613344 [Wilcoxina mikolae CBS 423.85]
MHVILNPFSLVPRITVLLIPILIFRVVHMQRSKCIGVLFIFALGGVTLGISVISYGLRASGQMHAARVRKTGTFDQYVEEIRKRVENGRLASYAEGSCAMLMLCLPSFRVLLRKFIDSRSPSDDTPKNNAGLRRSNVLMSYHSEDTVGDSDTPTPDLGPSAGAENQLRRRHLKPDG